MWGYDAVPRTIVENTNLSLISVPLTRAIARVDVSVKTGVLFDLKSVYLYNYNRAGTLTPEVDNGSASGYNTAQWSNGKATAPHLPSLSPLRVQGPLEYIVPDANKHDFSEAIYTFEAAAAANANDVDVDNTCLVIGGLYDGKVSYYRVAFANLALLRNHRYKVEVKEVKGHGYATKEEAYAALAANIIVSLTDWEGTDELNEVVVGSRYYLAVDRGTVDFYSGGGTKSIFVKTNYTPGWSIDASNFPNWLHVITPAPSGGVVSGAAGTSVELQLQVDAIAAGNVNVAEFDFTIVAGILEKTVKVIRRVNEDEFDIIITDANGNPVQELLFGPGVGGDAPDLQTFTVKWAPSAINCTIDPQPVGALPDFFDENGTLGHNPSIITSITGGERTFSIQPPVLTNTIIGTNLFYAVATRLDFMITIGDRQKMLPLYLRQVNHALAVEDVVADGYLADGTTDYTFHVKSTGAWKVSAVSDPYNILQDKATLLATSGPENTVGGTPFTFKLASRVSSITDFNAADPAEKQTATVTFESLDGSFAPVPVTITSNARYLMLEKYAHTTGDKTTPDLFKEHEFDVDIKTNMPLAALTTTTTLTTPPVPSNMLSAVIETGVSTPRGLKIHVEENTLEFDEIYAVKVSAAADVYQTLTVTMPKGYYVEEINNGYYEITHLTVKTTLLAIQSGSVTCPQIPNHNFRAPKTGQEATGYLMTLFNYAAFLNEVYPSYYPDHVRAMTWSGSRLSGGTIDAYRAFKAGGTGPITVASYVSQEVSAVYELSFALRCVNWDLPIITPP
jgi:hypothetical protein